MKTSMGIFLFNAWFTGMVVADFALFFGDSVLDFVYTVMTYPTVRDNWYLTYPLMNILALTIPLVIGIPITICTSFFSISVDSLEHKEDATNDSGSGSGCMCPKCSEIAKYGLTACEGCCGRE